MNDIDVKFEYEDYAIQGKMIVARAQFPSDLKVSQMSERERQDIRKALVDQIAGFMLDNKVLEFVSDKVIDPNTYMPVDRVAARCFVVSDSNVKIIRALKR